MDGEKAFAGKRALVIGGTGGIGRAIALGLAKRGAGVTVTGGNSAERLEKALAELKAVDRGNSETGHTGFLCKIGLPPGGLSPEAAAAFILEKTPSPDILVVSWGPFGRVALEEITPENWRFFVETNLIFPGIMTSLALCGMMDKGWGRILLFGGTKTAEIRGFLDNAAYGAAKTALGSLAKSAAKSAKKAGVCCNVVCPGLTATEYTAPSELAWYKEKSPQGKVLGAEDIARFALGVLEDSNINGAVFPVDCGLWV